MKKFWNLTLDELERSQKFYSVFLIGLILVETMHIIWRITVSLRQIQEGYANMISLYQLFDGSKPYLLIVSVGVLGLLGYSLFSWVREWYFQGNYIQRLLLLPESRFPVALAKVFSTLLMAGGMLCVQMLLIGLTNILAGRFLPYYQAIVAPAEYIQAMSVTRLYLPITPKAWFLNYSIGIGFYLALTNAVILLLSRRDLTLPRKLFHTAVFATISFVSVTLYVRWYYQLDFLPGEVTRYALLFVSVIVFMLGQLIFMKWLMDRYVAI